MQGVNHCAPRNSTCLAPARFLPCLAFSRLALAKLFVFLVLKPPLPVPAADQCIMHWLIWVACEGRRLHISSAQAPHMHFASPRGAKSPRGAPHLACWRLQSLTRAQTDTTQAKYNA